MGGYDDNICLAVSYQMHEIGHNLMLSQGGIIGNEDGDTSPTMGFSVNEDNANRCFNAPKNWLMGWYADRHKLLNPLQTPEFLGRLVGLSQYRKTVARDYVIVKIVGTNKNDIYVSLNTATGINSDTGMGKTLDIHVHEITNPKRSPLPQFARIGVKLMSCNDNKNIRFVYGKKKRSCSTMPVKYCNKVDDNGRIMRNYCHAKCNFCSQKRCLDEESYYWDRNRKTANSCARISRSKCTKRDKQKRQVKEFCWKKCSFCRKERAIARAHG